MPTRVRSFSKINLGLAVGPVIAGTKFHALATCYQTLEAHDLVTVTAKTAAETTITLTANHPGVPRTETGDAEKNTAYRLVEMALQAFGVKAEVHIDLDKRMPVQGGLGAGSANAAAALIALEAELRQRLSASERLTLAAEVGSDIPLFLLGGTSLGVNRGEEVYPLPDLSAMPCVLAVPSVGVSTALAFAELDARMAADSPGLKPGSGAGPDGGLNATSTPGEAARSAANSAQSLQNSPPVDKLKQLSHALALAFSGNGANSEPGLSGINRRTVDLAENPLLTLVRTGIENDFEEVAFSQHPSLRSTKRDLLGSGPEAAIYAALSGSGSALFGLYANEADALAAQQRVQANGTRALVTRTIPRAEYWSTMFAE